MNSQEDKQPERTTLESWKEIAGYLQRDAKTARKWEKEEGLPVHRHSHKSRSSVYAYPEEIDRWRASRKVAAEPAARPLWRIPAFAATMLLCLVMVGNGVRPQAAEAQQGQTRTLICSGEGCAARTISPNGKYSAGGVNGGLTLWDLTTKKDRVLVAAIPNARICCPVFSSDSTQVAYTRVTAGQGPEAMILKVDGTQSRKVFTGGDPYDWSPDGKRLLIAQYEHAGEAHYSAHLTWVDIGTGAVQKLPTSHFHLDGANVSPDGKYIAFTASKDGDAQDNVYIMGSDGSNEMLVSPSAAYQEPVGWTPDGKYLLYAQYGTTATMYAIAVSNGNVQGRPINTHVEAPRGAFMNVSRSGAIYYRSVTGESDIFTATMDASTGKVTSAPIPVPVDRGGGNVLPRWSPDSRRLLYYWAYTLPSGGAVRDLTVYSFETGKEERIAREAQSATGGVCWSRDGASILFNNGEDARRAQPVRYTISTNEIAPLFPAAAPFLVRSCSVELVAGFDATGIRVRSLLDGSEKQVYKFGGSPGVVLPVLSHDGRTIAFTEGTSALRIISSDGGPVKDLATAKAPAELQTLWGAAWSPDDRFLYFARRQDDKSPYELFRVPAAGGTPESAGLKVEDIRDLDIAPDGTRIAFSIGAVNRPEIWALRGFLPSK